MTELSRAASETRKITVIKFGTSFEDTKRPRGFMRSYRLSTLTFLDNYKQEY
jgi:hypothetical protein